MPDEKRIFDLTEYRTGGRNRVPCPHCKRPVPASATRCPHCRVHFEGEAYEFAENLPFRQGLRGSWIRVSAWVLIVVLMLLFATLIVGSILG